RRITQHLREHATPKPRPPHPGDGDELGPLQNQFWLQMIGREQLTNLNRERMLFVQEQKLLRRKLAPPDALPAREPMFFRQQHEQLLPAERMTRQVCDLVRYSRN